MSTKNGRRHNGRQLATLQKPGSVVSYKYDTNGIRTQKTVNGVITEFTVAGSLITREQTGSNITSYLYDENNSPIGMTYNGVTYYYQKNLQGDVIRILNSAGVAVVSYTYDAWGNVVSITGSLASTIGAINPFRYRSYYYDNESGFYYLNSRYYDPVTRRFINADSQLNPQSGLTGMNLYAYCGNNPVMRSDSTGHAWWHWVAAAVVVTIAAAAVVVTAGGALAGIAAISAVASGVAATSTAATIAAGAFIGSAMMLGTAAFTAAATSNTLQDFADQGSWGTVAATAGGAVLGGVSGYISANGSSSSKSSGSSSSSKLVGKAFDPKGPKVQIGVDPKTLVPSKDLATLGPQRLKNAEVFGREQALSVYRSGIVEDGNHRLANALANNRAVDIVIFP